MLLEQALFLHRQGEINQARSLYEQVLEQEPGHAQALHRELSEIVEREPENIYDRHMCNTLEYGGSAVILNLLTPWLQERDVQQAAEPELRTEGARISRPSWRYCRIRAWA